MARWSLQSVYSQCFSLLCSQLRDVELQESQPDDPEAKASAKGAAEFKRELEAHPLQFAFQDGVVDELCPAPGEPVWVLNIKRGILSTFQNSMPDFRIDSTVYEVSRQGSRCNKVKI